MKKYLILFFSILAFSGLNAETSVEVAESFLQKGVNLTEKGDYEDAVKILNRAMGLLREFPSRHPLRLKIEKQLRITKGKSIVSRYENRSSRSKSSELLPLDKESNDFSVTQIFGKVSCRKVWLSRENLEFNHPVGLGRRITVFPNSGIEIVSNPDKGKIVRSLNASTFDLVGQKEISLHAGSLLLGVYRDYQQIEVDAPQTGIVLSSDSPFACMFEVATNGGLKTISLLGKITLTSGDEKVELLPGELCFAIPGESGFSRKMSVELSTLMVTSKLITSYGKPLPFINKIKQQAMMQALRTRKRYRTVVGDAKNVSDFEVKVLDSQDP